MKSVWGWVRSQLLNLVPEIGSKVNKLRTSPFSQNVNISPTLYIKEEEVNTATPNIEKNYYRVDKKTTS